MNQGCGVSIVDEIMIEREGALEFDDGGVVPALVKQDVSKLGASLWQAGVEAHRHLRQFKGAVERSGTEIVAIEQLVISIVVRPRQHFSGARVVRVDRQRLFKQTPCLVEQCFGTSALIMN